VTSAVSPSGTWWQWSISPWWHARLFALPKLSAMDHWKSFRDALGTLAHSCTARVPGLWELGSQTTILPRHDQMGQSHCILSRYVEPCYCAEELWHLLIFALLSVCYAVHLRNWLELNDTNTCLLR
jgi:hypothetical protein